MNKDTVSACTAGLLSSGLFLFVFGIGLGFIFLFLPTLPLFSLGLSKRRGNVALAVIVATLLLFFVAGTSLTLLYCFFLALPTWYICKLAGLHFTVPALKDCALWFPLGSIILRLTLYGCGFFALTTLYYTSQNMSLPQLLSDSIHSTFAELQAEYGDVVDMLAGTMSFLMFPVTLWLWGILLYAHAWLANRLLIKRNLNFRPDFSVTPFIIPGWMLHLVAISALASLIGSESMSFLGKITVLSLMMPYFFLGISIMHAASKNMPSRGFLLFFVYFLIFSQFWPALILSGIGLWHQVKSFRVVSIRK